jgi:hypothetical protein
MFVLTCSLPTAFVTSGPVMYTAAIYVTLSKAYAFNPSPCSLFPVPYPPFFSTIFLGPLTIPSIEYFSPALSRIRPKLFYWIFIPCDIFCLTLQAAGGALSSTSFGSSKIGVDLALAGLSLQVVVLVVFCGFFADYMIRYSRSARQAKEFGIRMKVFFGFLSLAILLILARCAYRVDELSEGWEGPLISNEDLFIGLEGV